MARIYRLIEEVIPSNPTGQDMPIGENPVGDVPGEGRFATKEELGDVKKAVGEVGKKVEALSGDVKKMKEAFEGKKGDEDEEEEENGKEGAGEVREPALSGSEEPRAFKAETMSEALSHRKSVIGTMPTQKTNVRNAVKEYLNLSVGGI